MGNNTAINALVEWLNKNGISGNPLIDLRILDPETEKEFTAAYSEEYGKAPDGEPTPQSVLAEQAFAMMMGAEPTPKTKGDVLREWATELQNAFPRAYMKDYTREEAITMLNLLNRKHLDDVLQLQIIPEYSYTLYNLAHGWNETHPDEEEITFSGYDIMP